MEWVIWCCRACRRVRYTVEWWAVRGGCAHGDAWGHSDNLSLAENQQRYPNLDPVVVGPLPAWAIEAIK